MYQWIQRTGTEGGGGSRENGQWDKSVPSPGASLGLKKLLVRAGHEGAGLHVLACNDR